jgi:hypothetical protein
MDQLRRRAWNRGTGQVHPGWRNACTCRCACAALTRALPGSARAQPSAPEAAVHPAHLRCTLRYPPSRSQCLHLASSHRPGWRTGTALISSGGPLRPPVSAVRGMVTCAPGAATVLGPRAGQLIAALSAGLEMAPPCTPQLPRIFVYVPSDMRCLTAASIGSAIPLFWGIAIPYGAVP